MAIKLNFMFALINKAISNNEGDVKIQTNKKCLIILSVLYKEGLIRGFVYNDSVINIYIKYTGVVARPVIKKIVSLSTSGRPFFIKIKSLSLLAHTNDLFLISTIKGVVTLKQALILNVGGLLLCKVIL
jgi:small subunit ribosomal protein S8